MNWMIDGAHGDLYRQAMGYPELVAARDEWELERTLGVKARKPSAHSRLAAQLLAFCRGLFNLTPALAVPTHKIERSVS